MVWVLLLLSGLYAVLIISVVLVTECRSLGRWLRQRVTAPLMKRLSVRYPKLATSITIAGSSLILLAIIAILIRFYISAIRHQGIVKTIVGIILFDIIVTVSGMSRRKKKAGRPEMGERLRRLEDEPRDDDIMTDV